MRKHEMEISVVELFDYPILIPAVVNWFRNEWPDSQDASAVEKRLCGSRRRCELPLTLIAVSGSAPIGFVSLTFYEKGIEEARPHWIDALYVESSHRGQGLAQWLLEAAEERAAALGITELFALTEIPGLYHKRGWRNAQEITTDTGCDFIMAKRLAEMK